MRWAVGASHARDSRALPTTLESRPWAAPTDMAVGHSYKPGHGLFSPIISQ
jgi:hypothetical protein